METVTWKQTPPHPWPTGPWTTEPDAVQWPDPTTGLPCLARRGPLGAWCGYVGVPQDHPWAGRPIDHCGNHERCPAWCTCGQAPADRVDIHGGLTYGGPCDGEAPAGICHVPSPGEPAHVWWLGFDCAHDGDLAPGLVALYCQCPSLDGVALSRPPWTAGGLAVSTYRSLASVQAECQRLARQLAAVARDVRPPGRAADLPPPLSPEEPSVCV